MKYPAIQRVIILGAAVLSFSCAHPSSTLKQPVSPSGTMTGKGKIAPSDNEFEGTISRIDVDAGLIVVQHLPLSRTFQVTPDCQIDTLSNASAGLTDLKVGNAVLVTYAEAGKQLIAVRIVLRGKAHDREEEEKMERLDEMLNPSPNQ